MLWINLFLLGCIYLFLPIIYFQFRNNAKPKRGMILSVTLPTHGQEDREVLDYCSRFRKKLTALFWCLTAALLPFIFVPFFSVSLMAGFVWMDAAMVAIFWFYGKEHAGMKALKQRRGWRTAADTSSIEDNDDFWIWGQFYCNPNDRRTLVPDRTGMNLSTNFAKSGVKVLYAICILLLLALPLLGVWTMKEEFSPLTVSLTEQAVVAEHNNTEYEVRLEDVIKAELLTELPKTWKQSGSNMPNLYKGRFTVDGYGTCRVCLDPNAESFLLLRTENDIWLFSGEQADLRQILEVLP